MLFEFPKRKNSLLKIVGYDIIWEKSRGVFMGIKYLTEKLETFEIPLDNVFDEEYPDWGADNRGMILYNTENNTKLIMTYGFNNEYNNFEMYIESSDGVEDLANSWQKNLLYEVCRTVPEIEEFEESIEELNCFVLQLHMEGAPKEWSLSHPNGNIGIFVGLKNKGMNSKDCKLVSIKLMRPEELQYVLNNGENGKKHLAELYTKEKNSTDSNMSRKSVI